jgi:glycosyltransferase domain-containing protein
MDISIIIPTMNRPELLLRLVRYFDTLEFKGQILIGDSSRPEVFHAAASALDKYRGSLNLTHHHLPGRSVAAAVVEMNQYLSTRYVCLVADDDFIVPATTAKCIEFLNNHPDYVAAHGLGVLISSLSGDSSTIANAGYYPQTIMEEGTAATRLSRHLGSYSVTLFSVHRTEVWRKMFMNTPLPSKSPQYCDKTFTDELLQCCLSVVYGKVKQVDGLYLVRQVHDERYLLPTWFAWLNNERWHPSYLHFRTQLAQAIANEDCIPIPDAERIVDSAFATYLSWVVTNNAAKPNRLREHARSIPILRRAWQLMRELRVKIQPAKIISLSSLLHTSSPYHQDFFPVFSAVTRGNEVKKITASHASA